jgi:steroid delta-isomerase-like uncharacterized protein
MTHDEVVSFFAAQQHEWDRRDAEALTLRHADQGTIVSPIFHTVHGRAEILGSYRSVFDTFPDWHYVGVQLIADAAGRVAQEFTVTATHSGPFMGLPPSGRKFTIGGVQLFEMKDGLIAHERRYYDFTGLLIQIGILRGKPARD